ncbi:Uncharacterised protein [Segatella copri]|nr:Uncharacterised protein [Segatella copri]
MSETKTSNPSFFASTAAPAPLSPAPKITILLIVLFSILVGLIRACILSDLQCDDGQCCQNDGYNPETDGNL